MSKLRLLGDHILAELDPVPESYFWNTHDAREPRWATVRGVGTGRWTKKGVRIPVPLGVGDRVLVMPQHKDTKQAAIFCQTVLESDRQIIIEEGDILVVEV